MQLLLCLAVVALSISLQAKESWEMDTKEKLEQAAIVKEKGTMYFKVCDTWGRSRELCFWVLGASPRSPHWVFKGQKCQKCPLPKSASPLPV